MNASPDIPYPHLDALMSLMRQAGELALDQRSTLRVESKVDHSPVTNADRACERILVEGLTQLFPNDAILGEEGARSSPRGATHTWYIDPIDGTRAYIDGLGHWGPTIARTGPEGLESGLFFEPSLGTMWVAAKGLGAWRGSQQLRPRTLEKFHGEVLFVPSGFHRVGPLAWPGRSRGLGSTAAHLAHVASGGAAAALVHTWSPWDVGCGLLLLSEAGRTARTLAGDPINDLSAGPQPFIAGDPGAVDLLLRATRTLLPSSGK